MSVNTSNRKYIIKGFKIFLKSKYNYALNQKIKKIPNRYWNPHKVQWEIPFSHKNEETIKNLGFVLFEEPRPKAEEYTKYIKITKENRNGKSLSYWSSYNVHINIVNTDWLLPNSDRVKRLLNNERYIITKVEDEPEPLEDWEKIPLSITEYTSKTNKVFWPYQLKAVQFIQAKGGNGIIGDDMGIGKTIESLGYLLNNPTLRPALIICKATAKLNWLDEIREWIPNEFACVLNGGKEERIPTCLFSMFLINYDILSQRLNQILTEIKPKVIIVDECQAVKNQGTQRTEAFRVLCQGSDKEQATGEYLLNRKGLQIIPMSGTPILNRPAEFFTVLNILDPVGFPSWEFYKDRYCFSGNSFYVKRLRKKRNLELHVGVSKLMIRRLKEEVSPELPDKIRTITPIEIDNREEYTEAERAFIQWIRKNYGKDAAIRAGRAPELVFINKMRMLTAQGKLNNIIKWINDFLESDQKLIAFCTHKFMAERLGDYYKDISVKVVGGMTEIQKYRSITTFQNDPNIKLFIGNLKAAGDSINLTAASNVAFLELGWTPGGHVQAEDRAHREGQKDTVNVYYLTANRTIEDYLVKLINQKMETLNQILDGKNAEHEESMLSEIIKIYAEKEG